MSEQNNYYNHDVSCTPDANAAQTERKFRLLLAAEAENREFQEKAAQVLLEGRGDYLEVLALSQKMNRIIDDIMSKRDTSSGL
jgi:hypothetical protein